MGRQSGDHRGGGSGGSGGASSIALLQERFRKLEKMKEKREEMELLRMFPRPETMGQSQSQTHCYDGQAGSSSMNSNMTTRPCLQDSVSLGLNLYTNQEEPQKPAENPKFMDFWSVDSSPVSTRASRRAREKPEVDTSLHL